MALTDVAIRAAKVRPARYDLTDRDGLQLRVSPDGTKIWRVRLRVKSGERAVMRLGEYPDLGLSAARDKAAALRVQARDCVDPTKAPEVGLTIAAAVERFHAASQARSRDFDKRRMELHVIPTLGDRALNSITRRDVADLLADLAKKPSKRGGTLTAEVNRVRTTISALYSWAIAAGLADNNPVIGTAKVREASTQRLKAGEARVLSVDELRTLYRLDDPIGDLLRLLILVPLRRQEWTEAKWSEIHGLDTAEPVLRIPASRMKGQRAHAVPIPEPAAAILRARAEAQRGEFIFPGRDPSRAFAGWRSAAERLPDLTAPWVIHDLRRGVATAMADGGTAVEIIARILAHAPATIAGVTAVYDRSERLTEMRAALDGWAKKVTTDGEQ